MTLPASYPISMAQVNTELGLGATANITLNNAAVRTLFNKPSGTISMSDGWGKSYSTHTMTAGLSSNGSNIGYISSLFGSISPLTFAGINISYVEDITSTGQFVVSLTINYDLPQNTWTSIRINGKTYYSASASSVRRIGLPSTRTTVWYFDGNLAGLSNGSVYTIAWL